MFKTNSNGRAGAEKATDLDCGACRIFTSALPRPDCSWGAGLKQRQNVLTGFYVLCPGGEISNIGRPVYNPLHDVTGLILPSHIVRQPRKRTDLSSSPSDEDPLYYQIIKWHF